MPRFPASTRPLPAVRSTALAFLMACTAVATLSTPDTALAQARPSKPKEELKPPIPPTDKEAKANYWGAVAVVLGIGVLCAVNLIPSKRGHQD